MSDTINKPITRKEMLKAARGLIQKGWTQGVLARNAAGWDVQTKDPEACSWCVIGATIGAVSDPDDGMELLGILRGRVGRSLSGWNDTRGRTKEEVLALFDEAIASLTEQEKT